MTTFNASNRLGRETGRMLAWGVVGAGIAAVIGIWAGLWFGGYQALKHDEAARFWTAFIGCVALAALSGAVTGILAFFADGTNPFSSATRTAVGTPCIVKPARVAGIELPERVASRMRLVPHTLAGTARET